MMPKVINWVILGITTLLFLSACSKQEQEPNQPTTQEQGLTVVSLNDLYQSVRAEAAQAFRESDKEGGLRGLNEATSSQASSPLTITHSYQDELRANYTTTYKQEYERIMSSLSYETKLPKLEDIMVLDLPDKEKARLVTALALTAEIYATEEAYIYEVNLDTLLSESSFARDVERNRLARLKELYRNEVGDCVGVYMRQLRNAITTANNAYWAAFEDSAIGYTSLGLSLSGSATVFVPPHIRAGVTLAGGTLGLITGLVRGHSRGSTAETESLEASRAEARRELRECASAARERYHDRINGICTGRVILEDFKPNGTHISDSIPKRESVPVSGETGYLGAPQKGATITNPSDNKTKTDSTRTTVKSTAALR